MYKLKLFTQFLVITAFFLTGFQTSAFGQNCGALVCNNSVQISLGVDCEVVIEPDMVLESPNLDYQYEIYIYDEDGEFIGNAVTGNQVNTTLQYKVKSLCDGNSCWGNIDLETNVLPVLESPCQFIAGNEVSLSTDLSASNTSETIVLTASDDCQKVINLMGTSAVKYNSGSPGNPIWSLSDIKVDVYDSSGNIIYSQVYQGGAFSDIILLSTIGDYSIVVSSVVTQAVGEVMVKASVPNCNVGCVAWCGGSYPEIFLTPEQAVDLIDSSCGASLVSDVKVQQESVGDICDDLGVLHVITYSANITMHGVTQKAVLLTQAFREEKIDLSPNGIVKIHFPEPINLDCNLEDIDPSIELGSPEYIYEATSDVKDAYPTYVDSHTLIPDTNIIDRIIHIEDVVGTRDTMVQTALDLDGDGVTESVWVIITVVDKELRDSIAYDTIIGPGFTHPHIPIKPGNIFCNVLTSFTDLEFSACANGKKIIRSWSMIDWCDSAIQLNGSQQIEISDKTAPEVDALDDVIVSIDPWQCSATYKLPEIEYTDNCSSSVTVDWRPEEGSYVDGYLIDVWQNQGPIEVKALVKDECGNTSEVQFNLVVVDNVPPVMVCQGSMQTTLTFSSDLPNSGVAKIYAQSFNAGSHDSGCGDITFKVARMNGCCGEECSEGETICLRRDKFGDCIEEGIKPVEDEYGDYVKFCCEDAGQIVPVILVATDESGNQNQCMINVLIVDKSAPTLVCDPVTISCDDNPDEAPKPSTLGQACDREYGIELATEKTISGTCGNQEIIKEWFIDADGSGNLTPGDSYCEQTITIGSDDEFDPYTIKWPRHLNGTVEQGMNIECQDDEAKFILDHPVHMGDKIQCIPEIDADDLRPVWCETGCGLIGYSLEQDTINSSDACMTIINRWSVVDWCAYDPNSNDSESSENNVNDRFVAIEDWAQGVCATCPDNAIYHEPVYFGYYEVRIDGYYTFNQIVKVTDDTDPVITVDSSINISTTGGSTTKDDNTPCVGRGVISAEATDFCGSNITNSESLKWRITFYEGDEGVDIITKTGSQVTVETREGSPGEIHRIVWSVSDGCGNQSSATTEISFEDEKAPSPFCIAGITTAFMESDGTISIWAKDFDFGSFDNCTSSDDLLFTVVRKGEQPIGYFEDGFQDQAEITFSCSSMESFISLDLYVWDQKGNSDFCNVGILISDNDSNCAESEDQACRDESLVNTEAECYDDNAPVCGCDNITYSNVCEAMKSGVVKYTAGECQNNSGSIVIGGTVSTVSGQLIDNTHLTINSVLPEYPKNKYNEIDGSYNFDSNPIGYNYDISANRTDTYSNGVSTFDLVLIQKHILGLTTLDSPFKIIAADVNETESVTASDLVKVQKMVLGIIPNDVPVDDSWKFVVADQVFADNLNPWPYLEEANLVDVNSSVMSQDFIGIKMGDVSGDVVTQATGTDTEFRSNRSIALETADQNLKKGQDVSISLGAKELISIFGMQLTLEHNGLEFKGFSSEALLLENGDLHALDNQLMLSWYNAWGTEIANEALFTLFFTANEDMNLSDNLKISNSGMRSEIYTGKDLEIADIKLDFNSEIQAIELLGAHPNPMSESTTIKIMSPEKSVYDIQIMNVTGQIIHSNTNLNLDKGANEYKLSRTELSEKGIYYYQISGVGFSETRSILVID